MDIFMCCNVCLVLFFVYGWYHDDGHTTHLPQESNMHRRNRHIIFSAKNAGTIIVLDSRTIKGVSNGGSVNNWYDLVSNRNFSKSVRVGNATAPALINNVQGGQPVVRFDATLITALTSTWLTSENPSSYTWICTEIPRASNPDVHLITCDDGSFNSVNFSVNGVLLQNDKLFCINLSIVMFWHVVWINIINIIE